MSDGRNALKAALATVLDWSLDRADPISHRLPGKRTWLCDAFDARWMRPGDTWIDRTWLVRFVWWVND